MTVFDSYFHPHSQRPVNGKKVDILDEKSNSHVTSKVINIFIRSSKYKENDYDLVLLELLLAL